MTDSEIFYSCLLQNFNGEVGSFCAKVVEMIVSERNSVKSSKPNTNSKGSVYFTYTDTGKEVHLRACAKLNVSDHSPV